MNKTFMLTTIVVALTASGLAQQPGMAPPRSPQPEGPPILSPGPSAARFPRNAEEFDTMFQQVKNWGRWGKDDQLGAANLITDAKRKQALALPRTGTVVSLAHPPIKEVAPDNPSPFSHTMNRGLSTDTYSVSYHGYAHSHIDALCHILYKNQTYNGYAREDGADRKGMHEAWHRQSEERCRDARCPRRHPAPPQCRVPRARHAGLCRGSRSLGKARGRQGLARRRASCCAPAAGRGARRWVHGRSAATPPAITPRSRRG